MLVCSAGALSGRLTHCTETNSSGHYVLYGLPTGSYKVAFSLEFREFFPGEPPEPDGYSTQFYNGKPTLAAADTLSLEAPKAVTGIDAHLLSSAPAVISPAPNTAPLIPTHPKRHKCRKHFKKKKVGGKVRCVRVHHKRKHHRAGQRSHRVPARLLAAPR